MTKFAFPEKCEKHEELLGHYAWIKMKTIDGSEENETFEYFTPIQNGVFNQTLHFFNGEGNYSVSIFLPSIDQENYYSELTTFEVFNVNPAIRRDITYTPSGFDAGLIIDSPTTGLLEGNEQIAISGKVNQVHDKQTIMIQLKKDTMNGNILYLFLKVFFLTTFHSFSERVFMKFRYLFRILK